MPLSLRTGRARGRCSIARTAPRQVWGSDSPQERGQDPHRAPSEHGSIYPAAAAVSVLAAPAAPGPAKPRSSRRRWQPPAAVRRRGPAAGPAVARRGAVAARRRRRTGRSGARRRGGGASGAGHRRGRPTVAWPRPRCAEAGGAGRRRAALLQPVGGGGRRGARAAAAGAVHDGAGGPGVPRLLRTGPPQPRRARSRPPCALPSRRGRREAGLGGGAWGRPHKMAATSALSRVEGRESGAAVFPCVACLCFSPRFGPRPP